MSFDFSLIDTIRFKQQRELKCAIAPAGWIPVRLRGNWCVFVHSATKLRASFVGKQLEFAEVSMPRILYRCNSRVIASQSAVNAAVSAVSSLLDQITHPATSVPTYTRVDLAWQVRGDIQRFMLAYRNARTPLVHKSAIIYTDSGLRWAGKDFALLIYDKVLKTVKKAGRIIRIEAQLRGRSLEKFAGKNLTRLSFRRLYRAYRKILLSLNQQPIPKLQTTADLLALAEQKGIPLVDYWAVGKKPISIRRMRKEVAVRQIQFTKLNMKKLFPPLHPPRAVHLFHV